VPLLDHFHPPLSLSRHRESFHAAWATEIMGTLNRRVLPPGFFAEAQVHVGSRVEIDVATFEQPAADEAQPNDHAGGVAVETWAPPQTTLVMPALFPDDIEVQIFGTATGATLVAAIEMVSPGNKDRPEARRAFAARCASYLQQGIGLVIVDIVTELRANLHDALIDLLQQADVFRFPAPSPPLYTTAFRPSRRSTGDQIEIWRQPLTVGEAVPVMPLALRGAVTVPVDLEATYQEVCLDSRL
jgi:hypothetical protein